MAFKRALWKSGLTYQQPCRSCRTIVTYTDDVLDFRPWYPDGFVYCPKCKTPLRHNEMFAINAPTPATAVVPGSVVDPESSQAPDATSLSPFCSNCGKKFDAPDKFCSGCGSPRK